MDDITYNILPMTQAIGEDIVKWVYEGPYDLYNMGGTNEALAEVLAGDFVGVKKQETLIGFFCFGPSARVMIPEAKGFYEDESLMDIGLGMAPDFCGRGLGRGFFKVGLEYGRQRMDVKGYRLTVANFNERAIKTYKSLGFSEIGGFTRGSDGVVFLVMTLTSWMDPSE